MVNSSSPQKLQVTRESGDDAGIRSKGGAADTDTATATPVHGAFAPSLHIVTVHVDEVDSLLAAHLAGHFLQMHLT